MRYKIGTSISWDSSCFRYGYHIGNEKLLPNYIDLAGVLRFLGDGMYFEEETMLL